MEYELRKPQGEDLFIVCKIVRGIGLKNIQKCFNSEEIQTLRASLKGGEITDEAIEQSSVLVMTSIGDLLLEKMDVVKPDLINFMSALSGLKPKEVAKLPIVTFAQMVMDIIKEPDFVDFIKVVLKSFR